MVIAAVCVWGAAIMAFGLAHVLRIALALLAVAGWADVTPAVLRSTIVQTSVPEEFRSRISSVQIAVVEGGPRLTSGPPSPTRPAGRARSWMPRARACLSWLVVAVLDGEAELSEHRDRAGLSALEIAGGKALARGELIRCTQDGLGG